MFQGSKYKWILFLGLPFCVFSLLAIIYLKYPASERLPLIAETDTHKTQISVTQVSKNLIPATVPAPPKTKVTKKEAQAPATNTVKEQTNFHAPADVNPDAKLAIEKQIAFAETFNDGTHNLTGIDPEMVNAGKMFTADLQQLEQFATGQKISISLFNHKLKGKIEKKQVSQMGNRFITVKLDEDALSLLTVFYSKNQYVRGRVYFIDGSELFEMHGNVGFMMPIYNYKKMKHALHID